MIGAIPFTNGGRRLFGNTKHGTDIQRLANFANVIQQEFTIAHVPFCEIRERQTVQGEALLHDGYGLYSKVIITFKVDGERFGFPIYAPRSDILTPVRLRGKTKLRVKDSIGERFADVYPAENVEFETGWLCN